MKAQSNVAVSKAGFALGSHGSTAGRPIALVLGSGFTGLSGMVKTVQRVPYTSMDGFALPPNISIQKMPEATIGTIDGVSVVVYPRRLHLYHGYTAFEVTTLVRHARSRGCHTVVFVGASGAIDPSAEARLGLVSDHLNLTGENPLVGWRRDADSFVPMEHAYDAELRDLAKKVASERGIDLFEGVYAEMRGPSLETPAEVRALRALGATFVGMSLSLETIMARALGMRVLALTLATNPAGASGVSHRTVRAEATSSARDLEAVVRGVVSRI